MQAHRGRGCQSANANAVLYSSGFPATTVPASKKSVSNEPVLNPAQYSPVLPASTQTEQLHEPQVSEIQRLRAEMLATYEASNNLPLLVFAKLAGKSRDQINPHIEARRLLSLSLGNRGQRIPDWQLDPLRYKLVLAALARFPDVDAWRLYRTVSEPHERLKGRSPIDVLCRLEAPQSCLTNSTLRFCALPASVTLSATGSASPKPAADNLAASMPLAVMAATTALARLCPWR